jgi:hypothetical protein
MKEQQAAVTFGNKASKSKEDKKYDLIFDNQVDFVKADLMKGSLLSKRERPYSDKFKGKDSDGSSASSGASSDSEDSEE